MTTRLHWRISNAARQSLSSTGGSNMLGVCYVPGLTNTTLVPAISKLL